MSAMRQILAGIAVGLISLIILLGGLTLAIAEGTTTVPAPPPTHTATLPPVQPGDPTLDRKSVV